MSGPLPLEQEHLAALRSMRMLESYYEWVFGLVRKYIGRCVLDAGCGIGNFTALAAQRAAHIIAADLSPKNLQVMRERFAGESKVEPVLLDLAADFSHLRGRGIDTIVCLDVLEHVDDDVDLLLRLRDVIAPGGHLLLKVPAGPWMFGAIDVASEHRRRYTRRELRDKARMAGWEPLKVRYMNIAGVLPYWLKSRVLRKKTNFSRTFKPWQLAGIRAAVPMLKLIDRLCGPPLGQSAVLIARNPS